LGGSNIRGEQKISPPTEKRKGRCLRKKHKGARLRMKKRSTNQEENVKARRY